MVENKHNRGLLTTARSYLIAAFERRQQETLSALFLRTYEAMTVYAIVADLWGERGVGAGASVCVQTTAAFTHGFGPKGIRTRDIRRFARDEFRGINRFGIPGMIGFADQLARRQPVLKPELISLRDPRSKEDFLNQITEDKVFASWVAQYGNSGEHLHLIGIPNLGFPQKNYLRVFDTEAAGENHLPLDYRPVESVLSGIYVFSNRNLKDVVGVRFVMPKEHKGVEMMFPDRQRMRATLALNRK